MVKPPGIAIIPTFFVRRDTADQLMHAILSRTKRTRTSRRYPGFLRVYNEDYRRALLRTLIEDAADLIEMFGMREKINDLKARLDDPANRSAGGKLLRGILSGANRESPMQMRAEEFNLQAERYYREELRRISLAIILAVCFALAFDRLIFDLLAVVALDCARRRLACTSFGSGSR